MVDNALARLFNRLWGPVLLLVAAAIYYGATEIGNSFQFEGGASPFWPPAGVLVAVLLLTTVRRWVWILAGVVITEALTDYYVAHDTLVVSFIFGLAALAYAPFCYLLVRLGVVQRGLVATVSDTVVFLSLGLFMSLANGLVALVGASYGGFLSSTFFITWTTGDVLGVLMIVPLILVWTNDASLRIGDMTLTRWKLFAGSFVVLAATLPLLFGRTDAHGVGLIAPYVLLPMLLFAAWMLGIRATTLFLALSALTIAIFVSHGHSPFVAQTANAQQALYTAQIVFGLLSITILTFCAARMESLRNDLSRRAAETEAAISDERARHFQEQLDLLEVQQRLQERLMTQSKLAALGTLTAGVAHEVTNPLNFVINFAEGNLALREDLLEELPSDARTAAVEELLKDIGESDVAIQEHGRRGLDIMSSMLQLGRTAPGILKEFHLNALVENAAGLGYHGWRAGHHEKRCHYELRLTDTDPTIFGLEGELSRVIINIVGNACEAATRGDDVEGEVTVTTEATGEGVRISIADNGPGIPTDDLDHIFESFFTTKEAGEGTGLGLAISREIVEGRHGGTLAVSSDGSGCTFTVSLPRMTSSGAESDNGRNPTHTASERTVGGSRS